MSDGKKCINCGQIKSVDLFRGRYNTCKKCEADYTGQHIKENRDTQKTIYISKSNIPTYEEIEKQAKIDEKGVGSFLCKVFREWVGK